MMADLALPQRTRAVITTVGKASGEATCHLLLRVGHRVPLFKVILAPRQNNLRRVNLEPSHASLQTEKEGI